jgi:hypothetical protein
MGYHSEISVENLGSLFIYLSLLVGIVIITLLIWLLKNCFAVVNKMYIFISNIIFWNMFLRMFLEGYTEYSITSLMNIYKLTWDSGSDIFSSTFSIVIFIWIFLLPFLVWHVVWKKKDSLSESQ